MAALKLPLDPALTLDGRALDLNDDIALRFDCAKEHSPSHARKNSAKDEFRTFQAANAAELGMSQTAACCVDTFGVIHGTVSPPLLPQEVIAHRQRLKSFHRKKFSQIKPELGELSVDNDGCVSSQTCAVDVSGALQGPLSPNAKTTMRGKRLKFFHQKCLARHAKLNDDCVSAQLTLSIDSSGCVYPNAFPVDELGVVQGEMPSQSPESKTPSNSERLKNFHRKKSARSGNVIDGRLTEKLCADSDGKVFARAFEHQSSVDGYGIVHYEAPSSPGNSERLKSFHRKIQSRKRSNSGDLDDRVASIDGYGIVQDSWQSVHMPLIMPLTVCAY